MAQGSLPWADGGYHVKSWGKLIVKGGSTRRRKKELSLATNGKSSGVCWRSHRCIGTAVSWWVQCPPSSGCWTKNVCGDSEKESWGRNLGASWSCTNDWVYFSALIFLVIWEVSMCMWNMQKTVFSSSVSTCEMLTCCLFCPFKTCSSQMLVTFEFGKSFPGLGSLQTLAIKNKPGMLLYF